jgi:hypothetical protein
MYVSSTVKSLGAFLTTLSTASMIRYSAGDTRVKEMEALVD